MKDMRDIFWKGNPMKSWRKPVVASDTRAKFAKGGYTIVLKDRPTVIRGNKTSAGMQRTSGRSKRSQNLSATALTLVVFGSLDPLRKGLTYKVVKGCYPTCGTNNAKLILTDRGRLRLRVMRRKAEENRQRSQS
jgi:hypothetical protein